MIVQVSILHIHYCPSFTFNHFMPCTSPSQPGVVCTGGEWRVDWSREWTGLNGVYAPGLAAFCWVVTSLACLQRVGHDWTTQPQQQVMCSSKELSFHVMQTWIPIPGPLLMNYTIGGNLFSYLQFQFLHLQRTYANLQNGCQERVKS